MTKTERAVVRAAMRWHRSSEKALLISNQIYWGSLVSATTMLRNACARHEKAMIAADPSLDPDQPYGKRLVVRHAAVKRKGKR